MKMRPLFMLAVLWLFAYSASCSTGNAVLTGITKGLAQNRCTTTAAAPAGSTRRVMLFARNHIFVTGPTDGSGYDPNGTTREPSGFQWKNSDLVRFRSRQISELYPQLNKILEDNGANIYVYHSGYDIEVVTQDKMQAEMGGQIGFVTGKTAQLVADLVKADSTSIHVLWLLTSSNQFVGKGYAGQRSIVFGDDIPPGVGEITFAHEFGHALGHDGHVGRPGNLMNDPSAGKRLDPDQLEIIWQSLNQPWDDLLKLSCAK